MYAWQQWLRDHSPPPPPPHAPLPLDLALPCTWSQLGQVALHPHYNRHSREVPGASPIDEALSQAGCERACEATAACVAYSWAQHANGRWGTHPHPLPHTRTLPRTRTRTHTD